MSGKTGLLFAILLLALTCTTGCGVASQHTNTTKLELDIRIVYSDEAIKNCQKIEPVSATSGFGGIAAHSAGLYDVRRKMKNKTAELGGNVLRENNISSTFMMMGAKGDGIAYKCSPEWFNKISTDEKDL